VVPTVFLIGTDRLPLVPEFLNLGSVVVVAPDRRTLEHWRSEQDPAPDLEEEPSHGATVVDLAGRRIVTRGTALPLSDREFRVLRVLLARSGTAMSFSELRSEGWGEGPEMPFDVCSVRALVQRLRAKLRAQHAPFEIVSVRGFGYRGEEHPGDEPVPFSSGPPRTAPEGDPRSVAFVPDAAPSGELRSV
jgi:DNA-binding winged helix-turn-helix (wHTH) protein